MIWMCGNAHHYPTICHRYGICGHTQSKVPWSMLGTCKFRIISRFLFYMCVCVCYQRWLWRTSIMQCHRVDSEHRRTVVLVGHRVHIHIHMLCLLWCAMDVFSLIRQRFLVFNNSHNINSKFRTKFEIRLWFVGNKLQEKYAMVTFLCPNSFSCTFR